MQQAQTKETQTINPQPLASSSFVGKWLSTNSLTKKASLNAFAEALDYGARLIVGFIINPLLVVGLGDFGYGVWQVLGRLIGYMAPATGRPTQALKWTIANQQASTDFDLKQRQVGSAVVIWLLFLPLLAIIGGILAWFAPVWLEAPIEFTTSVRLAAALLVANLIIVSLIDVPRAVLKGENLGYKRMGLSAMLVFVGGGLTALAIYLNTGLVGVTAATLATTILTGLLFWQVARVYVPWFGVARPSMKAVFGFLKLSGWFLLWTLVMKSMRAGDVIILGIFDSAELVTTYSLTRYVPETLINLVAMVVFGITPGLGGIIGGGQWKKAAQIRGEMMVFTWLLITIAGTTILLWNQSFLQLWVGPEYDAGQLPTLLIVLMVAQFVFIRNDANIIDLTLDLKQKVLTGLLSVVLSVITAVILVGHFQLGIVGLCLAFMSGRLILTVGYPWLIGRFLNLTLASQLKAIVRPAMITAIFFAAAFGLVDTFAVTNWLSLVMAIGLTVAITAGLAFYSGTTTAQRQRLGKRVHQLLAK